MTSSGERLPWVGKPLEEVQEVHRTRRKDLLSIPGVIRTGEGFRINEDPPGNPVSREFVIHAGIAPNLTPEQIAQLPANIAGVKIEYIPGIYRPAARPAFPGKGE